MTGERPTWSDYLKLATRCKVFRKQRDELKKRLGEIENGGIDTGTETGTDTGAKPFPPARQSDRTFP